MTRKGNSKNEQENGVYPGLFLVLKPKLCYKIRLAGYRKSIKDKVKQRLTFSCSNEKLKFGCSRLLSWPSFKQALRRFQAKFVITSCIQSLATGSFDLKSKRNPNREQKRKRKSDTLCVLFVFVGKS